MSTQPILNSEDEGPMSTPKLSGPRGSMSGSDAPKHVRSTYCTNAKPSSKGVYDEGEQVEDEGGAQHRRIERATERVSVMA